MNNGSNIQQKYVVREHHDQSVHFIRIDIPWHKVPRFSSAHGGGLTQAAVPKGSIINRTTFWFTPEVQSSSSGDVAPTQVTDVVPFNCGGAATITLESRPTSGTFVFFGAGSTAGVIDANTLAAPIEGEVAVSLNDGPFYVTFDYGGAGGEPTQGHCTFLIEYVPPQDDLGNI